MNIGVAGRTGHNHKNTWKGNILLWSGKENSHLRQPSIMKVIDPYTMVHVFTRDISANSCFTYRGIGKVEDVKDVSPVSISWTF